MSCSRRLERRETGERICTISCCCSKTNPGHGVASLTEGRRAGICIFCETARQRTEPYPKGARKCKAEARQIVFLQGPVTRKAYDKCAKERPLATNPFSPPLIGRGGEKAKLQLLNSAFAVKQPGHGGKSIKDGRRAGTCIFCESARQRKEPYPKRALKCKAKVREIFFYKGQ